MDLIYIEAIYADFTGMTPEELQRALDLWELFYADCGEESEDNDATVLTKSSRRAKRRIEKRTKKATATRIYPRQIPGKYADHLAVCSCSSCGNLRSFYGPTLQEHVWNVAAREQLVEEGLEACSTSLSKADMKYR